jgi:uncharacterized membrane protein YbhN (UPF0104 family)
MKLFSGALYERIGREVGVFALCLLIAELVNVAAILIYKSTWRELYTQVGWLIVLAGAFYLVSIVARMVAARMRGRRAS